MNSWQALVERAVGSGVAAAEDSGGEADLRRRRTVAGVTFVIGSVVLGFTLAVRPGDSLFYVLTMCVAAIWVVGGRLSGPVPLGLDALRGRALSAVSGAILIGLVASAVFVVGALIVREIGPLRDYVEHVLSHARRGSAVAITVVTVISGVAEEVFFRGGLFAALTRARPVLFSTMLYTLSTLATANPMLAFAALAMGGLLAAQRRASGGVLTPMITHVTWSVIMLFVLPPLLPS